MQSEPSALCHTELASGPLWRSSLLCLSIMRLFFSRPGSRPRAARMPHMAADLRELQRFSESLQSSTSAIRAQFLRAHPADRTSTVLTWARGCPGPIPWQARSLRGLKAAAKSLQLDWQKWSQQGKRFPRKVLLLQPRCAGMMKWLQLQAAACSAVHVHPVRGEDAIRAVLSMQGST